MTHTGRAGDFGADLVLDTPVGRVVVQAKAWAGPVGHQAVQEVLGGRGVHQATRAMVIATHGFTPHARALARANDVDLWDRAVLIRQLARCPVALPVDPRARLRAELRAGSPRALRALAWSLLGIVAVLGALVESGSSGRRGRHRRRAR